MEYTAASNGIRCGLRQNPHFVRILQKLLITVYFSALIPLGDAGVSKTRPRANPRAPKIWANRPPHGMTHQKRSFIQITDIFLKVLSVIHKAGDSLIWIHAVGGIYIMVPKNWSKTLITFLLKEVFKIFQTPAPTPHAVNHYDVIRHDVFPLQKNPVLAARYGVCIHP